MMRFYAKYKYFFTKKIELFEIKTSVQLIEWLLIRVSLVILHFSGFKIKTFSCPAPKNNSFILISDAIYSASLPAL